MAAASDENPCGGPMGFITLIVVMFVMLMLFDPNIGEAVADSMGYLMAPFTFGDKYPMMTIFVSGVILVIFTSLIRHKFTDWYDIAKTQKIQTEFNKELRDATLAGNEIKRKKLQEMQPQILKLTNKMMFGNLRVMVFTMLFAILIWRWLLGYLDSAPIDTASLPWEPSWHINDKLEACPFPFPYWIAIYFVVSVPIGQVLISVFKVIEFSKDARVEEKNLEDTIRERLDALTGLTRTAAAEGVSTTRVEELRRKADAALMEGDFELARRHLEDAESTLEQNTATRKRTMETISTVRTMIDSAKARGVDVSSIEATFMAAQSSLARHDYTKAIYYSKQCQQKLKKTKEKHTEAEDALKEIQSLMAESPDSVGKVMSGRLKDTESAMGHQRYDAVLDNVKMFKGEIDTARKTFENAESQLASAKELRNSVAKLSINITKLEDKLRNAEDKFNLGDYRESAELSRDVVDELSRLKKLYEDASESVSFAKLIVANAANFGANVSKAEGLVSEAEMALNSHDYEKALSKATTAKNLAEDAKRQIQREEKRKKR
jgi:uncharacterized membrane protein (DUF106 family)